MSEINNIWWKKETKKNSRNEIGGSDAKMVVFVRVINYHFFVEEIAFLNTLNQKV